MKRYYTWSIDNTQSTEVEATVMIYDDDVGCIASECIGQFSMYFKDVEQIKAFLDDGVRELEEFVSIMKELNRMAGE